MINLLLYSIAIPLFAFAHIHILLSADTPHPLTIGTLQLTIANKELYPIGIKQVHNNWPMNIKQSISNNADVVKKPTHCVIQPNQSITVHHNIMQCGQFIVIPQQYYIMSNQRISLQFYGRRLHYSYIIALTQLGFSSQKVAAMNFPLESNSPLLATLTLTFVINNNEIECQEKKLDRNY